MAKKNNARILQTSTSEVYGNPLVHPQKETYCGNVNTVGIRACYDEGKRIAETLFFDYHRTNDVDIRVMRIFNTYGPRMHPCDGRVVSNFILQARLFWYVDDLIAGMICLMNTEDFTGPINMGNPSEFTIKELADEIIELTGSRSRTVYVDLPQDDPKQRRPDISLANETLGWKPVVTLREGLIKTIAYYDELFKNNSDLLLE